MLDRLGLRRLHLVDPWAFQPQYGDSLYGGKVAKSQADMDEVFESVVARFASEITSGRVIVHRERSLAAAEMFEAETFDLVYIDGDHTHSAVRADLVTWSPLVKPSGVLAGDDYCEGRWWDGGVKRAVDEFAESASWQLSLYGGQFAFRRADRHPDPQR
jgi:hypothetical protein